MVLSALKFVVIFFPYFGMPLSLSTLSGLLSYLNLVLFSYVFLMPIFRQPTPVRLPGKSHAQRSLVGCSPWGREELDTTKRLHLRFSLSCIGEGNGNPFQCSCLENPRDGGAWWAAVSGVAESDTTEAT